MSYDSDAASLSRRACVFIELLWDGTDTYRYHTESVELPVEAGFSSLPLLKSVSMTPMTIRPGDGLGIMQQITVTIAGQPDESGTGDYWPIFRANNPYYIGQTLYRYIGYVKKPIDLATNYRREEFSIISMNGPNNKGEVSIVAVSKLRFANRKKSVVPIQTTAQLLTEITQAQAMPFDVDVTAGKGDENFGTAGEVNVSGEVFAYTRVLTEDKLRLTDRAVAGTPEQNHEVNADVQEVYKQEDANIADIYEDWLTGTNPGGQKYMNGLTAANIDASLWADEAAKLATFTFAEFRVIEPTPLEDLLNEGGRQTLSFIWWDPEAEEVKIQAIYPVYGDVPLIVENVDTIQDSYQSKDRENDRVTRVQVYFNQRNEALELDELANYKNKPTYINASAEADWGEASILQIQSRFIETLGQSAQLGGRLSNRYSGVPRDHTFQIDASLRSTLGLGVVFDYQGRWLQNPDGTPRTQRCQVISQEEIIPGHRWRVTAEEFAFTGRYGLITPDTNPEDEPNPFPDYSASTDTLRDRYASIAYDDRGDGQPGFTSDGADAYRII